MWATRAAAEACRTILLLTANAVPYLDPGFKLAPAVGFIGVACIMASIVTSSPPAYAHRLYVRCNDGNNGEPDPSPPPSPTPALYALPPLSPRSPTMRDAGVGSPAGEGTYSGQRNRKGKKHGFGRYDYSSGSSYQGEYFNGLKEGRGVYTYWNGNRYEGEYKSNVKDGQGVYHYSDTGERYEGQFRDDKIHGAGSYFYANGDVYEGTYVNGEKRGKGVLIYRDRKNGATVRRELEFKDPMHEYPLFH